MNKIQFYDYKVSFIQTFPDGQKIKRHTLVVGTNAKSAVSKGKDVLDIGYGKVSKGKAKIVKKW